MDREDSPGSVQLSNQSSYKTNSEIISLQQQINMISHMLYVSGER